MHVLIVNFRLDGMTEDQYAEQCDELAPAFADVPGLATKTWLADRESNTYGGVYMFEDRAAFKTFAASDLARTVATHPNLGDVTMRDYGVFEAPTRVTRGPVGAAA